MPSPPAISISASTAVHVGGLLAAFAFSVSLPEPPHYHTHSQRGSVELRGAFADAVPEPAEFVSLTPVQENAARVPVMPPLESLAAKPIKLQRRTQSEPVSLAPAKLPAALEDCLCDAPEHEIKTPKRTSVRPPELVAAVDPPKLRRKEPTEVELAVETSVELPAPQSVAGTDYDTPPKSVRSNPQPQYPEEARQRLQTGKVVLEVRISASGVVLEVRLFESSGVAALDRAALETVAKWQFESALRRGQRVESLVYIPVNFRKSW